MRVPCGRVVVDPREVRARREGGGCAEQRAREAARPARARGMCDRGEGAQVGRKGESVCQGVRRRGRVEEGARRAAAAYHVPPLTARPAARLIA
eukprot:7076298-Prymnesium_polylepis.1